MNLLFSVPLLTGALFLCYNIFGMIVGFHPISRVKLLFGVAFFVFRIKPFTLENTSELVCDVNK
ncbi:bacteriophage holin [Lactococcus lactis]|uniref:Bacteriophage holin n=1 Tax=Lactococcus lactis TaxID=1358 RepID=A0AAP3Z3A6_9LACT|nr:bacteriophage holin [Lactococcus lactis]MDG4977513.1 bacteriophage holin [Lactococcus lactis]